jgi:hypothetical protein
MPEVTQLRVVRENWTKSGPVLSDLDEAELIAIEGRAAATSADSCPMGFWALATGSWILGAVIGAFPNSALIDVIPILIGFAGIAQFIAGLYAYRRTNVLAATAFCSFGAFYATLAIFQIFQGAGFFPHTGNWVVVEGFLYESFAFIALALAGAAFLRNVAMSAAFAGLFIGYALIGIPYLANSVVAWDTVYAIGGWFLCASALASYYVGAALVVNSMWGRMVLPLVGEP